MRGWTAHESWSCGANLPEKKRWSCREGERTRLSCLENGFIKRGVADVRATGVNNIITTQLVINSVSGKILNAS